MLNRKDSFLYKAAAYSVAVFLIILSPAIFNDSSLARFFSNKAEDIAADHTEELFRLKKKVVVSNMVDSSVVGLDEEEKMILIRTILEEGERYGIDPLLVLALIEIESTFYPMARSAKNAYGLMQIRHFVGEALAKELDMILDGEDSLFNPVTNVRLGTFYLYKLISRFNHLDIALAAYNYGPTHIERAMKNGYSPPIRYSRRVLNIYRNLIEETKLVNLNKNYRKGIGLFSGIDILFKPGFLVEGLHFIKRGNLS